MTKVKIKQFKNKAKEPIAGLTPEHAIYDKNGVRLDAKLGNVNLQEFRDLQQQGVNAIKNQAKETLEILKEYDHETIINNGTINNAADEEDITVRDNVLSFKDRTYTEGVNEMGYIILRKNKSFAEQVIKENTIYEIRYNFILENNVTIPANCILKFNGGSIGGEYTLTGNNTNIQAGLTRIFNTDITFDGTWNIETIDIRWFGIIANDNTIDCTPIIEKIYPLNKKIHFPKGTFYLSALHIVNSRNNQFYIEGEPGDIVNPVTIFKPYTAVQSYIIKAGGSKNKLDGCRNGNRAYNINIINIGFQSNTDYNPINLDSEYNSNANYYFGALILDKVEIGHFSIYGSGLKNTPLLVMGYSYECHFDFITTYGHTVKNDMPLVYIINNQQSAVSATYIEKMMCEVCFGPIIKTSEKASIAEFIINSFIMEGTVTWEQDTVYLEEPNWNDYNIIPIFELYYNSNFQVNFISLTRCNIIWDNVKDVSSKHNIRTFLNAKLLNSADITFNNIFNNGASTFQYINSNSDNSIYQNIINVRGNIKVCQNSEMNHVMLNTNEAYNASNSISNLITGKKIYGIDLKEYYSPLGITTVGKNCTFSLINTVYNKYETILYVKNKNATAENPILNKNGFYINSDYLVIGIAENNNHYNNWRKIALTYRDSNGEVISSYSREDRFYGGKIYNFIIKIDKSINFDNIIIENLSAYKLLVYFIEATNDISNYVNTYGTFANKPLEEIVGVGFKYFCTDRQTVEGATNGIEIIHKGNNVWVDALGRVVS